MLVWFHILLHVSSFPLFSGQNLNVPSCLCKYLLFSEETFCFFSNVLSRKNVEMKFKLVAGALQQAEGQDVGGLLHLLHIHLCQPLHSPDDRYSRVSLATRMDLSVHPTKPGVYYLKKISSTSSYFDRIIPLYPPDDHFSRVSLATRINQTWSMRPSKEWLVSSTSKSSPYFWVKMEQFVCESSVLVKGGLLPMHSLSCFDRIITLISFTTTTTYQINCPTKYKKRNST